MQFQTLKEAAWETFSQDRAADITDAPWARYDLREFCAQLQGAEFAHGRGKIDAALIPDPVRAWL